ncbi:hypothetical protein PIIN_07370 [Serendipita indica DSM 11827]|uniref:Fork-head domain-containing protein n=1 Tax=Serendipita indica (strain DSM 11827) TaxID=1109443 RepID=G4TQ17_SERID|nr:hypothetical protein PIIN_07370 [Serendipita indica DSM 11827]
MTHEHNDTLSYYLEGYTQKASIPGSCVLKSINENGIEIEYKTPDKNSKRARQMILFPHPVTTVAEARDMLDQMRSTALICLGLTELFVVGAVKGGKVGSRPRLFPLPSSNEHPFDPLHNSMIYEANSTDFLFDPISASVVTPTVGLGSAAPAALGEQTLGGVEINWDILSNDCFMQCFTTTAPSFANTATSVSHLDGGTQNVVGYEENRAVELSLQDLATIEDVLSRAADSCLAHPSPSNWAEGCAQPNPDIQEDYTKGDEISGTLSTQSDAHERESQHINPIDAEERRGYPYWGAEHSDQPPSYVSTPILRRAQGLHTLKDPKPGERPPYNLRTLIKMAILGCPDQRLQIDQIFEQIMGRFEYYRLAESKKSVGWKNSIRHQLSLYACFVKREKERGEVGRGVWWTVDESADPSKS